MMAEHKRSVSRTWVLIVLLALWFVAYSLFTYLSIGDKGPPDWDFGIVEDVPAQSPYASYRKLPYPQHVRGERGE